MPRTYTKKPSTAKPATKPVVAETPWQRQGIVVSGELKSAAAIKAAKLDWPVELKQSGWMDGRKFTPVNGEMHVIRGDNKVALGTSTVKYNPLQNKDAFNFLDDVVGNPDLALINCAGYLNEGRYVWVQMKIPSLVFEALPGDIVQDYLTIFNSHAADRSVTVLETPIRLVAGTTGNKTLRGNKRFRIKHTSTMLSRLRSGAELLRAEVTLFNEWHEQVRTMVSQQYKEADAVRFALDVIQGPRIVAGGDDYNEAASIDDLQAKQRLIADRLLELMESGKGTDIKGVRGSGWGLFNAVTEYVDHYGLESTGRGGSRPMDDRRLDYMVFGNGADMKERALVWLLHGRDAMLGRS